MVFDQSINLLSVAAASSATLDSYGYESTGAGEETTEHSNVSANIRWVRQAERLRGARPEQHSELVVTIRPGLSPTHGWRVYWQETGQTLYVDNVMPLQRERAMELQCSLLV